MGTGSDENLLPTEVTQTLESRNIEGVAAGDSHSIAWDTRGNVYTWGRNKEGQLGHGFRDPPRVPTPQLVQGLRHERIIGAAAGPSHTLCYTQQGALYAFGAHHKRVQDTEVLTFFGRGREMPEHKRRMILKSHVSYFNAEHMEPSEEERPDATQEGEGEQETSGGGVTALVEAAQEAGEGVRQQMTLPSHADQRGGTFQRQVRAEPWRVPLPSTSPVVHVAAGHSFSAVVTQRGELLTWGYNDKGQLGHGDRHTRDEAEVVRGLPPMASVSCGEQHCVAVARDGSVWGAGLNVFGQLGLGDREDRLSFSRLPSLPSSPSSSPHAARPAEEGAGGEGRGGEGGVKAVACGLYHTVLLSSASQVLVCGHREYGQQGEATDQGETEDGMGRSQSVVTPRILPLAPALLPSDAPPLDPAALAALPPVRVKSIASGALHSMAVTEDGRLVTWGWGGTGSLGHGWGERMGRRFAATPARQVEALRGERVLRAVGGRRHTLALTQSAWRSGLASEVGSLLTGAAKGRWDDVVFKVNNASVEACRSVLQARSPRLGAAIAFASSRFNPCAPKHPSSGPARIQLTLPGVRSEAGLRALLTFLYTDSLNVPPSRAREVKALALTYRLPRLAALCQQTMDAAEENAPPPPPALVSGEGAEGHVGEGHEGLGASLLALREGFPVAADIMLVAGGAPELPPLYAHKCILAARCEFFATAFDSLFVEGSGPSSSSSSSASSSSSLQAFALGLDDELADALLVPPARPPSPSPPSLPILFLPMFLSFSCLCSYAFPADPAMFLLCRARH